MMSNAVKDLVSMTPKLTAGETYKKAISEPMENLAQKRQEESEFAVTQKEDVLRREAERGRKKAGALRAEVQEIQTSPEFTGLRKLEEETMGKEFIPTKDTAQDIASLYSLVNVIGMAIGSGGKQNAMQAMHAMNGMLEGYQKGRGDLYKREKDIFDTSMKTLKTKTDILQRRLKEIAELASKNAAAADQEADVLFAEQHADFLKKYKEKFGLPATVKLMEDVVKAEGKATELTLKEREIEERRKAAAEEKKASRDLQLQIAKIRAGGAGGDGKPLKESELSKIEGLQSLSKDLQKLKSEFKDEYASLGLLGFGADLSYEAKRRLGDEEGRKAVQWWSKYERLQAPNRHALFGATLTGNELKNYQSFTAKKSDDPSVVRDMVQDQIDYTKGTADNRRLSYESAGYKVPDISKPRSFVDTYGGGVTPQSAEKSTGKYSINQVLEIKGKKYRVTGLSNPDDPDVEEVK